MLKILGVPIDNSATSYHRLLQPLFSFNNSEKVQFLNTDNLEQYSWCEVIYTQCLYSPSAYEFYRDLVRSGKKLVIDYDDDYLNTPNNIPNKTSIINRETGLQTPILGEERNYWVKAFLRLSDHIVVTTEELKKLYEPFCNSISVIPNCVSQDMRRDYPKNFEPDKVCILWSGSTSHIADLEILVEPLTKISEKYANKIEIHFQGSLDFNKVFKNIPIKIHTTVSFQEYLNSIQEINPDIALLPLENNSFNNCRSNLKYLQMSLMESSVIASPVGPYTEIENNVNGLIANSSVDWFNAIEKLILNSGLRKTLVDNSKLIINKYDISNFLDKWARVCS